MVVGPGAGFEGRAHAASASLRRLVGRRRYEAVSLRDRVADDQADDVLLQRCTAARDLHGELKEVMCYRDATNPVPGPATCRRR